MIPPILPSEPTHGKINEKVWGIWALQIYIYIYMNVFGIGMVLLTFCHVKIIFRGFEFGKVFLVFSFKSDSS